MSQVAPAEARHDERAARKAERIAAKRQREVERARNREQAATQRAAERREQEAAVAARAWEHYLRVREWARAASRDANGGAAGALTAHEQQMVAALAHLWDASPDVIATLRRSCGPITGVTAEEYDEPARELALRLKYQVGFVRRHVGADLFVQESPLLGGFGVEWHRQRYNEDTVRYFKGLAALSDAAVLPEFRGQSRRVVWEVGGGWGGFAFQFKTVCPNVTYLITGIPEQLLVSAVYLMTAFPEARTRFYDASTSTGLWNDWQEVDFIFAPESVVATVDAPRLDAALDLMALRHMTADRASLHVRRAFELGARYVFSQMPGPCFPEQLPPAWQAVERFYWPHIVPPRLETAAFAVDDFDSAPVIDDYAHLVGWRRVSL
jgi:hypothetical protein